MSTDTARYDEGVRLPEACRFCGSANMGANSGWTRVHSRSHEGERATTLTCHDCGGSFTTRERGNKRATTMDDMTLASQHWQVPEGYCLSVCAECGRVIDAHEWTADNREFLRAIQDGTLTSDCCDAVGTVAREWYDVPLGSRVGAGGGR